MGDWNSYKVKTIGGEVNTWFNGHKIYYIKDEKIGRVRFYCPTNFQRRWDKLKLEISKYRN